MKTKKIFFSMLVLPCLFFQNDANAQTPASKIDWFSHNMGFASSAAVTTTAKSAAGQAFVGTMQQGNTRITSGFLAYLLFRGPTVGVSEREDDLAIPATYELQQNYPNPFNPGTTITFALPKPAQVTLKIFDVFGREVTTLAQGRFPAGWHQVTMALGQFSSGVYFYRLQADGFSQTRRLMLVK